jgi:sirohydrochlorin ferrochelatase
MPRQRTASRTPSQLARLEQRVTELRRARVPDVVIIPVFADDAREAADAYAGDLERHLTTAAPGTVVVLLARGDSRPAGAKPAWASPRKWLDT